MEQAYNASTFLCYLDMMASGGRRSRSGLGCSKPPAVGVGWWLSHRGIKGHEMSKGLLPPSHPPFVQSSMLTNEIYCPFSLGNREKCRGRMTPWSMRESNFGCPMIIIAQFVCPSIQIIMNLVGKSCELLWFRKQAMWILIFKKTYWIWGNSDKLILVGFSLV